MPEFLDGIKGSRRSGQNIPNKATPLPGKVFTKKTLEREIFLLGG